MQIELLHHTPIETIAKATSMPYRSKPSNKLVENVWNANHRSIARHGMAVFSVKGISQSLLRQLSRHPHINLSVTSTRYCDMNGSDIYVPNEVYKQNRYDEYVSDMGHIMQTYSKWKDYEGEKKEADMAKMFLPLASTTDLVLSGNYQALYEFLSLRNCTRAEEEIRKLSLTLTRELKKVMPEIFKNLGCRGDDFGYCPETHGSCGKHPTKENA